MRKLMIAISILVGSALAGVAMSLWPTATIVAQDDDVATFNQRFGKWEEIGRDTFRPWQ